ncbi:MAG: aromatic-ring-hydroxylating dioxygenase subunit beta [Rhodospirillaceae bacterium]
MSEDIDPLIADLLFVRQVEEFLYREAALLDDGRIAEWLGLFAADGFYWVPGFPGQESPFDASSPFYGDVAAMRARFLQRPGGAVAASRTVSNILVEGRNAGLGAYEISARYVLAIAGPEGRQAVHGGRYDYALLREGDSGFRIAAKRASVVTAGSLDLPLEFPL